MIELTTGLFMLASAFTGTTTPATTTAITTVPATTAVSQETSTEQYVREYFKGVPILAEVARCESSFRQYDSKGNVLRGVVNRSDIGVMQINKYYHEEDAQKLGLDIYTIDGNLAFGKWLYDKYGVDPWSSSAKCWSNSKTATDNLANKNIVQAISRA